MSHEEEISACKADIVEAEEKIGMLRRRIDYLKGEGPWFGTKGTPGAYEAARAERPIVVVDSPYVQPFQVAKDATLDEFLIAWSRAHVAYRGWRTLAGRFPPILCEEQRTWIEAALNVDLERAGRSERVQVSPEMIPQQGKDQMDMVLSVTPADASPASAESRLSTPPELAGRLHPYRPHSEPERGPVYPTALHAIRVRDAEILAIVGAKIDDFDRIVRLPSTESASSAIAAGVASALRDLAAALRGRP